MAFEKPLTLPRNQPVEPQHMGWLGKAVGIVSIPPGNVAAITVVMGLLIGAIVTGLMLYSGNQAPYEIWKYLTPIITGALGFLFGKK